MRQAIWAIAASCVAMGLGRLAPADDQADARAIVERGIKAVGGEKKLEKHNAVTWKDTGMYYGMGEGLPYTANYAAQWPHQFRMDIEGVFIIVRNGDKGWISMNGETREMNQQEMAQQKEEQYFGWVATLVPLKDKQFKLSTIGQSSIDGRPAVGVNVSAEKHGDVKLFFDQETGLLVKCLNRVQAPEQGYQEVDQEVAFRDYQEIDGVKVSMKRTLHRDGKLFVESESHELKAVGKLDDSVFDKP